MVGQYSLKERIEYVKKYHGSGLTQMKFCEVNNISFTQFKNWVLKFKKEQHTASFLPVKIVQKNIEKNKSQEKITPVILIYGNVKLKMSDTISSKFVLEILRGLEK